MKFVLYAVLLTAIAIAQTPPSTPQPSGMTSSESLGLVNEASETIGYVYDSTGKVDPFRPYRAPRLRGDNRPVAPVDPLSLLDVSKVNLVAIMWNTTKPRAVIKDGQGRTFTIVKNTKIGRNEGVVVDIREGEVVIVEKFDDGLGNIIREARVLEMKIETGEDKKTAGG